MVVYSALLQPASIVSANNAVIISVNFDYPESDFIFLSNLRRYRELSETKYEKTIVTSNINSNKFYLQIKYRDFINSVEAVRDNAGLMAIKFLISCGVKEVFLAGFDGYSHDTTENYADSKMEFINKDLVLDAMNKGMEMMLKEYAKDIKISFLTTPKFVRI